MYIPTEDKVLEMTPTDFEKYSLQVLNTQCHGLKNYKRRIEREIVQTLYDKLRATGTQKGILISTSNFQTGSIQYATEHGIALIQLTESGNHCVTRSLNMITNRAGITPSNFGSPYVGVLLRSKKQGLITCSYLTFLRDGLKPFLLDEE